MKSPQNPLSSLSPWSFPVIARTLK